MSELLRACTQTSVPCKCCGSQAKLFGVVDFHKNCVRTAPVLEPSGIPIYYHRCDACGFTFTIAFDSFSPGDFMRWIYNEDYARVDPEYAEQRPADNAAAIHRNFAAHKDLRILDYGGGNGRTADLLRQAGFTNIQTYDPFVPQFAARPAERFDLVTAFEVVEHSHEPMKTFTDMEQFMKPDGMIFFTTALLREEFRELGLRWWYVAPRNGHVSIYSWEALLKLSASLGLIAGSEGHTCHIMCRQPPAFALHLFQSSGG